MRGLRKNERERDTLRATLLLFYDSLNAQITLAEPPFEERRQLDGGVRLRKSPQPIHGQSSRRRHGLIGGTRPLSTSEIGTYSELVDPESTNKGLHHGPGSCDVLDSGIEHGRGDCGRKAIRPNHTSGALSGTHLSDGGRPSGIINSTTTTPHSTTTPSDLTGLTWLNNPSGMIDIVPLYEESESLLKNCSDNMNPFISKVLNKGANAKMKKQHEPIEYLFSLPALLDYDEAKIASELLSSRLRFTNLEERVAYEKYKIDLPQCSAFQLHPYDREIYLRNDALQKILNTLPYPNHQMSFVQGFISDLGFKRTHAKERKYQTIQTQIDESQKIVRFSRFLNTILANDLENLGSEFYLEEEVGPASAAGSAAADSAAADSAAAGSAAADQSRKLSNVLYRLCQENKKKNIFTKNSKQSRYEHWHKLWIDTIMANTPPLPIGVKRRKSSPLAGRRGTSPLRGGPKRGWRKSGDFSSLEKRLKNVKSGIRDAPRMITTSRHHFSHPRLSPLTMYLLGRLTPFTSLHPILTKLAYPLLIDRNISKALSVYLSDLDQIQDLKERDVIPKTKEILLIYQLIYSLIIPQNLDLITSIERIILSIKPDDDINTCMESFRNSHQAEALCLALTEKSAHRRNSCAASPQSARSTSASGSGAASRVESRAASSGSSSHSRSPKVEGEYVLLDYEKNPLDSLKATVYNLFLKTQFIKDIFNLIWRGEGEGDDLGDDDKLTQKIFHQNPIYVKIFDTALSKVLKLRNRIAPHETTSTIPSPAASTGAMGSGQLGGLLGGDLGGQHSTATSRSGDTFSAYVIPRPPPLPQPTPSAARRFLPTRPAPQPAMRATVEDLNKQLSNDLEHAFELKRQRELKRERFSRSGSHEEDHDFEVPVEYATVKDAIPVRNDAVVYVELEDCISTQADEKRAQDEDRVQYATILHLRLQPQDEVEAVNDQVKKAAYEQLKEYGLDVHEAAQQEIILETADEVREPLADDVIAVTASESVEDLHAPMYRVTGPYSRPIKKPKIVSAMVKQNVSSNQKQDLPADLNLSKTEQSDGLYRALPVKVTEI